MKNERKEELKDEMKNRISLALKDPTLQQGFEIICKNLAELEKEKDKAWWEGFDTCKEKAGEANVKLNDELEKLKKHLEELPDKRCRNKDDYCPHLAKLEKENAELKEINEGYCRNRDRLVSMGFPNFKDCKEYAEYLTKAKDFLKQWLQTSKASGCDNINIVAETEQFLKEEA